MTARGASTRRGVWVVLDQGLSSLTNFGLSILVLRTAGPREFGAFTVVLTTYLVALYMCRALAGEPQLVRHSHASPDDVREATKAATGVALVVGVVVGVFLVTISWMLHSLLGTALLCLAVVLPGLLLQDAWRYAFFAKGEPFKAFLNDLVWALLQVAVVGGVLLAGNHEISTFVLAWGVSATAAAAVGAFQAHDLPRPARAWSWLTTHRDLGPRFAAEVGIALAAWQLVFFTVGAVGGLAVLGTLSAARTVLGPFNAVALGAVGFAVPEGTVIWRTRPERLAAAAAALGTGLALVALVCVGAALLLPNRLGTGLLGETWPAARSILPFVGVWVAAEGAGQGPRIGMMVLGAPGAILNARAITAPLIVLGAAAGAYWGAARGAAIGLACAHSAATALWWRRFRLLHGVMLKTAYVEADDGTPPGPVATSAPVEAPILDLEAERG